MERHLGSWGTGNPMWPCLQPSRTAAGTPGRSARELIAKTYSARGSNVYCVFAKTVTDTDDGYAERPIYAATPHRSASSVSADDWLLGTWCVCSLEQISCKVLYTGCTGRVSRPYCMRGKFILFLFRISGMMLRIRRKTNTKYQVSVAYPQLSSIQPRRLLPQTTSKTSFDY